MTENGQPWAARFMPRCRKDIVDNERAVAEFVKWVRSWERGIPKNRAVFLYGPPGVGKTSAVCAVANDLSFDLLEVNASDHRTRSRLEELIGRAALQSLTVLGRRRMILLDELEGVSGRKDRGGITAIVNIIKETRSPVVLVATSAYEEWEDKFRPLRGICLLIEFDAVPFADVLRRLRAIAKEVGIEIDEEALEALAERSNGDLRSAINDLEAVSRGKEHVSLDDVDWLSTRDRKEYTPDALMRMFSAKSLFEARRIINASYIGYDDLFDWIHENLPLVLDNPQDLADGMDALARADIHQRRARSTQAYRLLKYMFNEMTGGVALSRQRSESTAIMERVRVRLLKQGFPQSAFTVTEAPEGIAVRPLRYLKDDWRPVNSTLREMGGRWERGGGRWIIPRFRPPQNVWRYRRTWHSRRLRSSVASRVAEKCHISKQEAVVEVLPLLKVIFQGNEDMAEEISGWLELEGREKKWLRG
jgi:replication factor C large subunit